MPCPALLPSSLALLGALLLGGAGGDVGLSLRGGYQGESDEVEYAHRAQLGLGLDVGLSRRARLQLGSRYSRLLWRQAVDETAAPPERAGGGLDLSAGATVLIDTIPGVDPLLLVELIGGYHPLPSALTTAGWTSQVRGGAAVGAGVDVYLGAGWVLGLTARYTLSNGLDRWLMGQAAATGLGLELGFGYRFEVGRDRASVVTTP